MLKAKVEFLVRVFYAVTGFLHPATGFVPMLAALLFLGAMFWAKSQDPFSRQWFTVLVDGHLLRCVAVLPKPVRARPVIIYAHGSGGSLMNDGNDLRQMAEMGLVAVSLEYNQSNRVAFNAQFESVLNYVSHQKWADSNAIAWVGFSQGANWMLDFARQYPGQQPQLLVQISGAGLLEASVAMNPPEQSSHGEGRERHSVRAVLGFTTNDDGQNSAGIISSYDGVQRTARPTNSDLVFRLRYPVLLVHSDQDEIISVADTQQFASVLQSNGVPVELKIVPGLPHGLEPERGVVFRSVGEYCLTHLTGKDALQDYHSISQWQAEAPGFWLFCLPAVVVAGVFACRRASASPPAERTVHGGTGSNFLSLFAFGRFFRAAGRTPSTSGGTPDATRLTRGEIALRWVAAILATWALTETALHLVPPHCLVSERTLSIARRILVQPKERAGFETLARRPIWQGQKLGTLLTHVQLANYNRELINWQLDATNYDNYVLSPVITGVSGETFDWRRPLWEEFYPRIRHESSPEEAARIVVRHLRERVTIAGIPDPPRDVPTIWLRQLTDQTGFEIIYVAALRSVGVPARLDANQRAEFWDGSKWSAAPSPAVISW